jgi:non-ribosomal peptide synthetase component F
VSAREGRAGWRAAALPADFPRSTPHGRRATVRQIRLREDAAAICAAAGVPLPALGMTGLAALLHHYTGAGSVRIGYADHGLTPVRLTVRDGTAVGRLLQSATAALPAAGPAAGGSAAAGPAEPGGAADARFDAVVARAAARGPGSGELRYADVALVVDDRRGRWDAALLVDADLFAPPTADRLARHAGNLLMAALEAIDLGRADTRTVGELDLTDADERAVALVEWNETDAALPADLLPELIHQVAARSPDAPAVVSAAGSTSFAELDADADRLAGHLIGLGLGRGGRAGVLLDPGAAHVLAQLAILRAGGSVLLLDPAAPADTVTRLLAAARTDIILSTGRAFLDDRALTGGGALTDREALTGGAVGVGAAVRVVDLAAEAGWRSNPPGHPPVDPPVGPRRRPDPRATSHIRVRADGRLLAAVSHAAVRNTVHALWQECGITADTRGSWLSRPDSARLVVDCLAVLAAGGTVCVPEPAEVATPERLRDWLVTERVTYTVQPARSAERLWRLDWPAGCRLRVLASTGGRLSGWPPPGLPFTVFDLYWAAETTLACAGDLSTTAARIDPSRLAERPPVGRPVPNMRAYVLDRHLRPVPPGVAGELYVSGAGVSPGFPGAATATRFVANPVPVDPSPILYRTGDVARYWPDGVIDVLGRLDAAEPAAATPDGPPPGPGRPAPFELTAGQRALAAAAGVPDRPAAVDYYEWDCPGLDVPRLLRCWRRVVERHDALRTVLLGSRDQVLTAWPATPELLDLRRLPAADAAARLAEYGANARQAGLGRPAAAAHRLWVARLPGGATTVHLLLNRLLIDPDSAHRILFDELAARYAGTGRRLRRPAVTFREYALSVPARWAERAVPPENREGTAGLGGRPAAPMPPLRRPDGAGRDGRPAPPADHRGAGPAGSPPMSPVNGARAGAAAQPIAPAEPAEPVTARFDLDPDRWAALRRRAAGCGASSDAVLVTALADVVRQAGPAGDGQLGWRVFNRIPVHPDVDRVLGYFVTVRTVDTPPGWAGFAERARAATDGSTAPAAGGTASRGSRPGPAEPRFRLLATVLSGPDPAGPGFGELTRIESTSPDALADVRVVPHGGSVRAFWTAPGPADQPDRPDLAALGRAYQSRLEQLADDARAWWSAGSPGPDDTDLPWIPHPDR